MNTWQERISRVGFFTSAVSYAVFWFADLLRPGFVARYVSVHLFLLAGIAFGICWSLAAREYRDRPAAQYGAALACGAAAAALCWNLGAGFEEYRLLAVAGAFVAPSVVLSLIRGV